MIFVNIKITDVFLGFEEMPAGENFILELHYEGSTGGGVMKFNPLVIPKMLKMFHIYHLSMLKGLYARAIKKEGEKSLVPSGIQHFSAKDSDDYISTDNRYFGTDFYIEECIK